MHTSSRQDQLPTGAGLINNVVKQEYFTELKQILQDRIRFCFIFYSFVLFCSLWFVFSPDALLRTTLYIWIERTRFRRSASANGIANLAKIERKIIGF